MGKLCPWGKKKKVRGAVGGGTRAAGVERSKLEEGPRLRAEGWESCYAGVRYKTLCREVFSKEQYFLDDSKVTAGPGRSWQVLDSK